MANVNHFTRKYLFDLLEEHIRNGHHNDDLYNKATKIMEECMHEEIEPEPEVYEMLEEARFHDEYFTKTREFLRLNFQQQSELTEAGLLEIKDDIRKGIQHYGIVEMMGISPKNQLWFTELLVELYACKFTGKPAYSKPVVSIKFQSDSDVRKFMDKFVDNRILEIGGIKAIDWDINRCHNWCDEFYLDEVDAEPDFPVMSFDIEHHTIMERYPFGPSVDFELLEKQLRKAGIKYTLIRYR